MAQRLRRKAGGLIKGSLVGAISLALVLYLASSVYEKLYVVQASSAMVVADLISIDAPTAGRLFFQPHELGTEVKTGEPLVMISTDGGTMISVDSPCDCIIKERLAENHARARAGEPVLKLASLDARPYVKAFVPFKQALRVQDNQTALLRFAGRDHYIEGVITHIRVGGAENTGQAMLTIVPRQAVPVGYIDDPVEVRVDTFDMLPVK